MRAPDTELPICFADIAYGAGAVTILSEISLSVAAGRPTAVIGPNGAGKSTLLRLAIGLIAPTAGRISWGGRPRTDGRRLAMMFQRPAMLRRSAAANVAYALEASGLSRRQREVRVHDLLHQVGLGGLAGRPARRLSGGEQQRLALARALAREPQLLCLDEPTASLDPASTKAVEDIITRIAATDVKIVLATHDLGQARRLAGDVVFMLRGRIHEHADAATFFAAPATPEAAAFLRGDLVI